MCRFVRNIHSQQFYEFIKSDILKTQNTLKINSHIHNNKHTPESKQNYISRLKVRAHSNSGWTISSTNSEGTPTAHVAEVSGHRPACVPALAGPDSGSA